MSSIEEADIMMWRLSASVWRACRLFWAWRGAPGLVTLASQGLPLLVLCFWALGWAWNIFCVFFLNWFPFLFAGLHA